MSLVGRFSAVGLLAGLAGVGIGLKRNRQEYYEANERFLKYGLPESNVSFHSYHSHCLEYDRARKIPVWVLEKLSSKNTTNIADRIHSTFQADPEVPCQFSAANSDYLYSGWDRGHMACAGNYKYDQKSMDDTFYLTNIIPQEPDNNRNYWYRLEKYCRGLLKSYDDVTIICGPLFIPKEEDGKKFIHYEALGSGNVNVPTHLFKIILAETDNDDPPLLGAFIMPNTSINHDVPLTDFQVSLEDIEKFNGVRFFERLQKHKVKDLCKVDGCKLMPQREVDLYRYTQRMQRAENKQDLEKLLAEVHSNGFEPDKLMLKVYNKKVSAFDE
jgi:nuclease EXOG